MKKIALIGFLAFVSLNTHGQNFENQQVYLNYSIGGGKYLTGNLSLGYTGQSGLVLAGGVQFMTRQATNIPDDYVSANKPFEDVSFFYLASGKSWRINTGSWRINLTAGLGIAQKKQPTDFVRSSQLITSIFGSGYEYDYAVNYSSEVGFIQKGHIEVDISRVFGLGLGYTLMFSSNTSLVSGEVLFFIGLVRDKK